MDSLRQTLWYCLNPFMHLRSMGRMKGVVDLSGISHTFHRHNGAHSALLRVFHSPWNNLM